MKERHSRIRVSRPIHDILSNQGQVLSSLMILLQSRHVPCLQGFTASCALQPTDNDSGRAVTGTSYTYGFAARKIDTARQVDMRNHMEIL